VKRRHPGQAIAQQRGKTQRARRRNDHRTNYLTASRPASSNSWKTPAGGAESGEARTAPGPHDFNGFNGFQTP
jgi:hypothetical protein